MTGREVEAAPRSRMHVVLQLSPDRVGSAARTSRGLAAALAPLLEAEGGRLERAVRGRAEPGARRLLGRWWPWRLHADVLHAHDATVARRRPPTVATLPDPFPAVPDEHLGIALRAHRQRAVARLVERARLLVAWNGAIRDDVLRYHDVSSDRVEVVHPGVDPVFTVPEEDEVASTRARLGLERPYLLTVGSLGAVKNLSRLVQAYARAGLSEEHDLVLAGRHDPEYEPIARAVEGLGLDGRVHAPGVVSDRDLRALYGGASAVAHLALQEAHALPVLEALACGAPVVAADRWAAPEVAGGHAGLCDPTDVDAIGAALRRAVDRPPAQRAAGRRYAESFTWEHAAERVLSVYRRAVS